MTLDNLFNKFSGFLEDVLPTSPFQQFIQSMPESKGFQWLNWLLPIGDMINVMSAWLGAIALFYIYSIILRWIKAIGD